MQSRGKTQELKQNGHSSADAVDDPSGKLKSTIDANKTHPTVYIVFFSLLLDLLAFTMILPLLPSLLEHYRVNDKGGLYSTLSNSIKFFRELVGAPERYTSVLFGGFLGSMFSFLQFIVSPIAGGLSDYYGRKPILLLSLTGIMSSYGLWALSKNFGIFVLARFIGGLSKGNISLSMAIITDVSNKQNRGKGMALVGIAFSLGFILGPMIGAIFSRFSDKSNDNWFIFPALFAMCLAGLDVLFCIFFLKETLPLEKRAKTVINSISQALEHVSIKSLFRFDAVKNLSKADLESLKELGFIYFTYLFLYSGLEFTVTFLMFHKFGFNSIDQAKMFLTTGVIMALLQGGVVKKIKMEKTKQAAVLGLILIVPSFVVVGLAKNVFWLYFGMILFAISTAFCVTCMTTLTAKYGNFDQKGTVLGIFRSHGALARALGPIVSSTAFWLIGSTPTYLIGGIALLYPTVKLYKLKLS
ncbi:CLUMA_CG005907, isoform A [Clunio marinus]|uniref:CLUMA_CG005907, isoform A n=1 Tax=Clunio marinus TaxID=568069 RepID=A0A1J1HWJ0_9DIPT|nr:CLUMA_CG005907, isoform A [Clunio marinus]